uniref:PPR_long domain-containing protein n=1 Tax=Panagrellus redivivus TaxID=6233 RepID=A0A7E4UNU0_PANRE
MSGYNLVRRLNPKTPLLNAALSTTSVVSSGVVEASAPTTAVHVPFSRRRVLSETDRRRASAASRRHDGALQRFKEVQRERKLFIERHRDAIEEHAAAQKDLTSMVDSIEFTLTGDRKLLQKVLSVAKTDITGLSGLSDRQFAVLLNAGGRLTADQVPAEARRQYVDALWQLAVTANFPFGIQSWNARIAANLENGVEVDVVGTLKDISAAQLEPNEETFGILAQVYAQTGKTAGILQIISLLKEQNIPATQPLFESLVYSTAFNSEDAQVSAIIKSLSSNPSVSTSGLYIAAALAKARSTKDPVAVAKVLAEVPHALAFKSKENLNGILEVVFTLADARATGIVEALRPYFMTHQPTGTLPIFYDHEGLAARVRKLFYAGNVDGAVELYELLDSERRFQTRIYFEEKLLDVFKRDPASLPELASKLRAKGIIKLPLTKLIERALQQRISIFALYEIFLASEEFTELTSDNKRPHLHLPLITNLLNQLEKTPPTETDIRLGLFNQIAPLINFSDTDPRILKKLATALVAQVTASEKSFSQVLQSNRFCAVHLATLLVNEMFVEQLDRLEALMKGPLANEKLYLSRVHPVIVRYLRKPHIDDSELRTIAAVVAAGFPSDGQITAPVGQSYGFRCIRDLITSNVIGDERLQLLIKLLSEEPNVTLAKEEVKKIESELRSSSNKSQRADWVKQLQRKSKAVVRWLSSDVDALQEEANFLETKEDAKPGVRAKLYDILLRKYADDTSHNNSPNMLNLLKKSFALDIAAESRGWFQPLKYVSIAMRRALVFGDYDTAQALWDLKKDCPPDLKLLYALCWLDQNEEAKAIDAASTLKQVPPDHVLIRVMQQKHTSGETLEKFVEFISKKFSISNLTRKRLTRVIKKMELVTAIEKGDLQQAFKVVEQTTRQHSEAFGQNDLMAACVRLENLATLKSTFQLVSSYHDRNTAYIDMVVAFLECNHFKRAQQLVHKAGSVYVNSSKMEFLTSRELELKRPDVLHRLFLIINDPDRASTADLAVMLEKCVDMYTEADNVEGLRELQNDIAKVKFNLERKLRAHLDSAIVKAASSNRTKKTHRTDSVSSSATTRSSSTSTDGDGHQQLSASVSPSATAETIAEVA